MSVVAGIVEASVQQLVTETVADRLQRIARAWQAYDGNAPSPLGLSDDGLDDNVRINMAELIVDRGATALMGVHTRVNFQIEGDDTGQVLERFEDEWPIERRDIALHQLAVNGGVAGHAVLRLKRNPTRVIVVDPSNFDAVWDDEDIDQVHRYTTTWTAIDPQTGEAYARRLRDEPLGNIWVTYDERSFSDGDSWTVVGEERWPFPWPPIFHCQHRPAPNEFWGRPALETHVLDLCAAVEGLASEMRRMVRLFGRPVPWITGESTKNLAVLDVALGELLGIPNKDARVGQLELNGDLPSLVTVYREIRQALHEVTKIPEVASGKLESAGALSGIALSILYGPLVELGSTLRLSYGPMLGNLAARILELAGQRDRTVTPQWPEIIPEDREATATRDEAELRMGIVSKRTVSERRGYDWEEEERRIKAEREAAAEAMVDAFNRGAGAPGGGGGEPVEGAPAFEG